MAKRKKRRARRANGEGSPIPLPNGKYKGVHTYQWKPRRTTTRTFESHADCVSWLAQKKAEKDGGLSKPTWSEMKLHEWITIWLSKVQQNSATGTYQSYQHHAEKFIVPHLGTVLLKDLSPYEIDGMFQALGLEYGGRSTLEKIYKTLQAALAAAVQLELIPRNPLKNIPKPKATKKDIQPFTIEEVRQILAATKPHRLHALFVVAFGLGLRQGELYGLRWIDVDFERGSLRIEQTAVSNKGKLEIKTTKTNKSRRTLALPENVLEALVERRAKAYQEGLADCPIVFPAARGGYLNRSTFAHRIWKPLLKKLGIKERGMHHTRHTFATHALAGGPGIKPCPIHEVSRILGHESPSITLGIYGHSFPMTHKETIDSVASLFTVDYTQNTSHNPVISES